MNKEMSPCDVIFNYVDKPEDYMFCKAINVFDNKWRLNIYSKRTINDIESIRISRSYFVKMEDNILSVLY